MKAQQMVLVCLLLIAVGVPLRAAGPTIALEGRFADMARDGTGKVWAAPKGAAPKSVRSEIASLEGQRWVRHKILDEREEGIPVQLVNLPGGEVMCLWRSRADDEKWLRSVHHGKEGRLAGSFRAKLKNPHLWPCSNGAVVLTEEGPTVIYLRADDAPADQYKIPDSFFIKRAKPSGGQESLDYVPMQMVEDGRHDLWLWCPEMVKHDWQMRLGGLVRFNFTGTGQVFNLTRVNADGLPLSSVVRWDEKNLAVAVSGVGLCLFPLDKHALNLMPEPEKDAFRYIEQLMQIGGDWLAVATPQPTTMDIAASTTVPSALLTTYTAHYDTRQPTDVLWKLHEGKWCAMHRALDDTPNFGGERSWLATDQGLWLASHQDGRPWLFPAAAGVPPFRLSPALGFTGYGVTRMLQADADHLLLMSHDGRTWLWPTALRPDPSRPPPFETFKTVGKMLQDSHGFIWRVCPDRTFGKWDGHHWTSEPLPPGVEKSRGIDFIADDRDQGWILPRGNSPTAVLDFKTGRWRSFDSLCEALEAQLPRGVRLDVPEAPYLEHVFSADGHIGGFFNSEDIALYDRDGWHTWKFNHIAGPDGRLGGTPFFSSGGHFCVPAEEGVVWQWKSATWKHAEGVDIPHPGTLARQVELNRQIHGKTVAFNGDQSAQDRFGVIWTLGRNHELYKYLPEKDTPVFAPDQCQPFPNGTTCSHVLVDDMGGAFIGGNFFSEVQDQTYIPAHLPVPRTEITVTENKEDTVRIKLGNQSNGETWYTWRLDDQDWKTLQQTSEILFQPLPEGEHRFEARAYNAVLTPDPKTAVVNFRVTFNSSALATRFLTQLATGTLGQREEAARSLANIGRSILPQLKAAREKAESSSARWWFDAVIQQIEQKRTQSAVPRDHP